MSKEKITFNVGMVTRERIADNALRLTLKPDGKIPFKAGQYFWLRIGELVHSDDRGNRRAFSIASSPDDETISIIFRGSMSGFKRSLLEMRPDDKVELIGPFGSFIHPSLSESEEHVFVAGGVAVAPFLSVLRGRLRKRGGPKIHLVYSEDSEERLMPDVLELKKDFENDESVDISINIGRFNKDLVKASDDAIWYFAGPKEMVEDAFSSTGLPMDRMRFEENYPTLPTESELILPSTEKDDDIYKLSTDNSLIHTVITDVNGRILYANKATSRITGFGISEIIGETPRLWGGLMDHNFYRGMWKTIRYDKKPFIGKVTNRRKSGERYIARVSIAPIIDPAGKLVGYSASEADITESEEVDRIKTELISLASHQLNTPVSTVNWYAEMMLDGDVGEITDDQRKYLNQIYDSSRRMSKLIDSLLDVSRMELGTFMMDEEPTDIVEISKTVIAEMGPMIEKKVIELAEDYGSDLPKITIDPKIPEIVIQNLVSNAVKYTPEGGKVTVKICLRKKGERFEGTKAHVDALCICVSDTGYGIPREYQGKIFTKMFRAENIKEYDTEGMGLGLYIVKFVVDRVGGSVWFKSKEGEGSTFFILLPLDSVCKEKQ